MTSRQFLRQLGRLGQRLGEGELRLEAARRAGRSGREAGARRPPTRRSGSGTARTPRTARAARRPGWSPSRRPPATRAKAFLPPSCQASSPHSVRTTVPSGFLTWGLPGEILLPTSTTRLTAGQRLVDARFLQHRVDPGQFLGRDAREQVIERQHRVRLAAAEVGLQLDDRVARPLRPPRRRTAPTSSCFRPSVRYVRRKNSTGSRYSSVPSPRCTCHRSAANSACW